MKENKSYDVIINGFGIVALVLACLLAKNGLKVALIANSPKNKKYSNIHSSTRLLAINWQSCQLLENDILKCAIKGQTINRIRVVENNTTHKIDFFPQISQMNNFGKMIDEIDLYNLLLEKVNLFKNVDIYQEIQSHFLKINHEIAQVEIEMANNRATIKGMVIVGADGKDSLVRKAMSLKQKIKDYKQTAIVADITHSQWHHGGIAVEKFRPSGPFAILPKWNGYSSSIVWTAKSDLADSVSRMSKDHITQIIKTILNGYLGEISLDCPVSTYPLKLSYNENLIGVRSLLVGDAAHSIHPVAGQGLNLGLRDVTSLSNIVAKRIVTGADLGSPSLLQDYQNSRINDIKTMIRATDFFVSIFSNDFFMTRSLREFGLNLFDKLNFCKRKFVDYACGKLTL